MAEQSPLNRTLLIVSLVLGTAYLFIDMAGLSSIKTFAKPLAIWALAAVAFLSGRPGSRVLGVGLLFGSGGDILLETGPFLAGVGSFLISQLIYAGLFIWIMRQSGTRGWAGGIASLILLLCVFVYGSYLYPDLGDMKLPIVGYFTAITLMGLASLNVSLKRLWAPIGAMTFLVSDSLIALGLFKFDFTGRGALVWITYVAAQYLITTGVLAGWMSKRA